MSWYEITTKVRVITKGTSRTSTGIKIIDASRKRLFRVAIMSCACLLMNTATTVHMSVVLEDWSVSSDQWVTCTVSESFLTRDWANYGFHVEDRYIFCLVTDGETPVGYCFDCCCFIFCTSPPAFEMGDDKSEEAADRRRGLLTKICSQERAVTLSTNPNRSWSDSTSVRNPILRN
jgi:hypothetical protein